MDDTKLKEKYDVDLSLDVFYGWFLNKQHRSLYTQIQICKEIYVYIYIHSYIAYWEGNFQSEYFHSEGAKNISLKDMLEFDCFIFDQKYMALSTLPNKNSVG